VKLEGRPAVPVDEEDRVVAGVDAGRRVVGQPALDGRGVDVVVVGHLEHVVLLVVVLLLERGERRRPGQPGEGGEEPALVGGAGVGDVVVVGEADAQALGDPAQPHRSEPTQPNWQGAVQVKTP
jgi:hypothetical protein